MTQKVGGAELLGGTPLVRGMAVVHSRVQHGMAAVPVAVEVHVSNGLPAFHLVGLPEKGVRESKERVRSAILNAGFRFPDRRITINLAPAHLPKPGSHLDLAMALGILLASAQLNADVDAHEFYGELALSGALRPIHMILASAIGCQGAQRTMITAEQDGLVAMQIDGLTVKVATSLLDVCRYLRGDLVLANALQQQAQTVQPKQPATDWPDLRAVCGQAMAKRALVLASAGGHNVVLRGPPGTAKTMLAHCLPGILPDLSSAEKIDIMLVHAMRGVTDLPQQRPFRQPHHSASYAAMVGGGQPLMPGEVSLAHQYLLALRWRTRLYPQFYRTTGCQKRTPHRQSRWCTTTTVRPTHANSCLRRTAGGTLLWAWLASATSSLLGARHARTQPSQQAHRKPAPPYPNTHPRWLAHHLPCLPIGGWLCPTISTNHQQRPI